MDQSPNPELMAKLAQHKSLGGAPAAEHAWLARHGAIRHLAIGDVVPARANLRSR